MISNVKQSAEPRGPKLGKIASAAALVAGALMLAPDAAMAQGHSGGGGGHGGSGGGGGYHGGGGGYHGGYGGGWHGGGWRGGYYGGWGGWCCGLYPGFGFGFGYDAFYDPFWAYGPYGYDVDGPEYAGPGYGAPPGYADDGYGPPPPGYGAAPQGYGPSQGAAPITPSSGLPTDNSRGFYRWPVGIQNGTCNRAYLQQTASNLQTATFLGGINVAPVIGGRIGPRLDVSDQACATESLERAQTGQTVSWQTTSGVPVTFQVTRTLEQGNSQCRDYVVTAQFGSHTDTTHGKACKQQNGSWAAAR
jgi:surface antigen